MRKLQAFILAFLLLLSPLIARGQSAIEPSGPMHVYLVTFGPGADPWEKFGHDCIVIEDDNFSAAYNWGVFDFGQGWSGFLTFGWHFVQGRLLYSMQSDPTEPMLDAYKAAGRSILVQELRLTRNQKIALRDHLEAEDTEANRYYLYDYFKKNCTTMARDAIDQVIGGQIAGTLQNSSAGTTLRWQDRRATADELWLYLFLDFELGHPVDQPLSAYSECFLPGVLARRLPSVLVPDGHGGMKSIVMSQKLLNPGVFIERQFPPAGFVYGFLAFGVVAGGGFCLLGIWGLKNRLPRWVFASGVMGWSVFAGLFGSLATFAVFTNHEAAKWNENWFQGNPLSLALILLAPLAFRWPHAARCVTSVVLGLSVFGLVAKLTPWFYQQNWDIIAAALPVHAGIAFGIFRLTQKPLQSPAGAPVIETEHAN